MMDELVLIDVDGDQIYEALENGVSQWPKLEGRFPQVSGITFAFDPSKPAGSRVNRDYVKVGDEYLDKSQHYKLVTKAYLAKGKDGYDALAKGTILVDDECAPNLTSAVQTHFQAIQTKIEKSRGRLSNQPSVDDPEDSACKLQPKVEGRIMQLTTEVKGQNNCSSPFLPPIPLLYTGLYPALPSLHMVL